MCIKNKVGSGHFSKSICQKQIFFFFPSNYFASTAFPFLRFDPFELLAAQEVIIEMEALSLPFISQWTIKIRDKRIICINLSPCRTVLSEEQGHNALAMGQEYVTYYITL